jgi:hypothetical protein
VEIILAESMTPKDIISVVPLTYGNLTTYNRHYVRLFTYYFKCVSRHENHNKELKLIHRSFQRFSHGIHFYDSVLFFVFFLKRNYVRKLSLFRRWRTIDNIRNFMCIVQSDNFSSGANLIIAKELPTQVSKSKLA